MTAEMKRLLDDPEHRLDRLLLESGLDEAPPARSLDKTLAALGVGAAVTVVATTTSVGAGAAATKATATVAATSSGWLSLSTAKLVGALAVAGLAAGGGYAVTRPATAPVAQHAAAVVAAADENAETRSVAPEPRAVHADQAPVAPAPTAEDVEPQTNESAPAKPRVSSAKKAAVAAQPADALGAGLTPEITLLDQARAALAAGNPDACLARIAAYNSRFPKGQLASDAKGIKARCEAKRSANVTP